MATILHYFQWPWHQLGVTRSAQCKTCDRHFLTHLKTNVNKNLIWYEAIQTKHLDVSLESNLMKQGSSKQLPVLLTVENSIYWTLVWRSSGTNVSLGLGIRTGISPQNRYFAPVYRSTQCCSDLLSLSPYINGHSQEFDFYASLEGSLLRCQGHIGRSDRQRLGEGTKTKWRVGRRREKGGG